MSQGTRSLTTDPGDEIITAPVAAAEKGVHRNSVHRAIREGRLKAYRSGKTYLIRRRDLDAWKVVGHRPARTPPPSTGPTFVLPSPEEQKKRAARVIQLLEQWMADESGYDEEAWPIVKRLIEENRMSDRKRFDD
jgi:excisionase family DNA binding protein